MLVAASQRICLDGRISINRFIGFWFLDSLMRSAGCLKVPYGIAMLRYEEMRFLHLHPSLRQGSYERRDHNCAFGICATWWKRIMLNLEGADHVRLRRIAGRKDRHGRSIQAAGATDSAPEDERRGKMALRKRQYGAGISSDQVDAVESDVRHGGAGRGIGFAGWNRLTAKLIC